MNPIWLVIAIGIGTGIVAGVIANYIYDALVTDDQGKQTMKQVTVNANGNTGTCNVTVNDPVSSTGCEFTDDGDDLRATFSVVVPEPSTLSLMLSGVLGLIGLGRAEEVRCHFGAALNDLGPT